MTTLAGRTVALSISDAADRARLGFPRREVERVLLTLCTALIRAGATIQYAGDLRPDGWTFKIFQHLAGAYAGQDVAPFVHLVPEPVLRRTTFDALLHAARESRGTSETVVVVGDRLLPLWRQDGGLIVDPTGDRVPLPDVAALEAWLSGFAETPRAEAFSRARRLASSAAVGRVALGGKLGLLDVPDDRYEGAMPGIAEEAIMTLEAGGAFVPLGAFGGATRDIAIALGLLPEEARVPRGPQADTYEPALRGVQALRAAVPPALRGRLEVVAGADRTEWLAREVVEIVASWSTVQGR